MRVNRLLVTALTASLVACGGGSGDDNNSQTSNNTQNQTKT